MKRVFLLSPANCNGVRAGWILRRNARSEMAKRLRHPEGVPLAEVYTFLSALYFRGKIAYARAFANPPPSTAGVMIITPTAGLMPESATVRLSTLRGFSRVPVSVKNRRYRSGLLRGLRQLAVHIDQDCEVILLGSIATGKYLDLIQQVFADQLRVPAEFIGLGDMSRGALLLRCVKEGRELNYVRVTTVSNRPRLSATMETAQLIVNKAY
jgi:hypothetical protein